MLLDQQRRGTQQRDLLLVGDGDERGAQRDFGLAEADIAVQHGGRATIENRDGGGARARLVLPLAE